VVWWDKTDWLGCAYRKLLLFAGKSETGVSIPYPSISLHAIQTLPTPAPDASSTGAGQGLYMQLVVSPESDEEELDTIALTIIPSSTPSSPPPPQQETTPDTQTEAQQIFEALSACSNLHPDPVVQGDGDDDEEGMGGSMAFRAGLIQAGRSDGGLPPSFAEGGWITAENMHEFVDSEGNFIGGGGDGNDDEEMGEEGGEGEGVGGPLGPGAGTVRGRDENGGGHGEDGDGEGEGTKWQRTD
jgi:chloride channel, nucleotide-sensitive, 1A